MDTASAYTTQAAPTTFRKVLRYRLPTGVSVCTLSIVYTFIWLLQKMYAGLEDDGQLYAFQAMAQLRPELAAHDLFLKYGSQDDYTLFTTVHAWLIAQVGLTAAGSLLTLICHFGSATAAWFIARRLSSPEVAWLALGVVLVMPGNYGALGVFEHSEMFLTARLPAEALTLTSIALLLSSRYKLSLTALALALLFHPLMAAPGAGLYILYRFPALLRLRYLLAAAAAFTALCLYAMFISIPGFSPMDPDWLAIVRERSYFMFTDEWRAVDWDFAALPLLTLVYATLVIEGDQLKRLVRGCVAVGIAGIALTIFSSAAIPVEILLKGQPWRWMWLAGYLAALLLPCILVESWRSQDKLRRATSTLICAAWIPPIVWAFPTPIASLLAGTATLLVWRRQQIPARYERYCLAFALGSVAVLGVGLLASMTALASLEFTTNREPWIVERVRDALGLVVPAAALIFACWQITIRNRRWIAVVTLMGVTCAGMPFAGSRAYANWSTSTYADAYSDFGAWREALDHRRAVLWPNQTPAVWFLLESPSYLSVSQTAGVVFSRETALESARRAAALEPLNGHSGLGIHRETKHKLGTLTLPAMRAICTDPELGYIVSKESLPLPHLRAPQGEWGEIKLYACDSLSDVSP